MALHPFEFESMTLDAQGRATARRQERAHQFIEDLGDCVTLETVPLAGGTFLMGASASEPGSRDEERPQHHVTVPSFHLGRYTVTIAQWVAVMGVSPDGMESLDEKFRSSPRQPVVRVSWEDAEAFCSRLSLTAGRHYRLPTEAEWEYACRAGTTAAFAFGESIARAVVNHDNAGTATMPVGSLGVANGFGLADMHGNVWEWCQDTWHGDYEGAPADGGVWRGGPDARTRVLRGGSWSSAADFCRSASRSFSGTPGVRSRQIGFRVAMVAGIA